jgi:WD40 repeat protein
VRNGQKYRTKSFVPCGISRAISPDNRWVLTESDDKTARLWDLSAKDPAIDPVVLCGHEAVVNAGAISPDNRKCRFCS